MIIKLINQLVGLNGKSTRLLHADATCASLSPKPSFASFRAERKNPSASFNFPWKKETMSKLSLKKNKKKKVGQTNWKCHTPSEINLLRDP